MKKIYISILICSLFSVSYAHADFVARAICLNTYTNALTKCGVQPPVTSPLAYARWAVCVNAAIAVYYACLAQSYFPFADTEYSESEYEH